jgi:hypothetical protein
MGILYDTVRVPNLHFYERELNPDGTEKHITCDGARFHVTSYYTQGTRGGKIIAVRRCSEPNCELNRKVKP